ncbi:hypothetical protein [Dongia sp.]|uniref:hypothetical protein n=1 Tax=Dongia sp. TaxID=1977262 RepID=UPI0035ADC09F
MTAGAKAKLSTSTQDVLTEAVRQRSTATPAKKADVKAEDARFANIAANTFFKVMFSTEAKPEEKKAEVAKLLTFEGTKEENRERIKEFELFKEYLQSQREAMAQEIIRLTDTETFAELKTVYDDLNTALLEFDNKMQPLTDIIDAIYTLRTNGLTLDAFQEIIRDRKAEEELNKEREAKRTEAANLSNEAERLMRSNDLLRQDKSFFGLGGIKASAQVEIDQNDRKLTEIKDNLGKLSGELEALNAKVAETKSELGEFAAQKAKLRELLDISTDEHKQRQRELVDSAINFVSTAKTRIGSVREHLGKMGDQVENLADANGTMGTVYAILNEGIKDAGEKNLKQRDSLQEPTGEEDTIAKMTREQKRMAVEQHITLLDASATDTMSTFADLTSGAIRIKTMKDAVDQQSIRARMMHSQGVSGVADRLSVVLQAVSQAALGEASAMAKDTLQQMAENTNKVAQKESIRLAMGIADQNRDLEKAIEDLGSYGEVIRTATSISKEGLTEMRAKLDELKKLSETVKDDLGEAIAVNADTAGGNAAPAAAPAAQANAASPFKFGQ